MYRLRTVLGFIASAMIIASSFAHTFLGWKNLSARLEAAQAPVDLIAGVALGWQWGGVAMLALGCIVLYLFARYTKDPATNLRPAQLTAVIYFLFGLWAIYTSHNPFFLVFVIPGLILGAASSGSTAKRA